MTRFYLESLRVQDVNDLLVVLAFQNVIHPDALYREILAKEAQMTTKL